MSIKWLDWLLIGEEHLGSVTNYKPTEDALALLDCKYSVQVGLWAGLTVLVRVSARASSRLNYISIDVSEMQLL